MKRSLKKLTLLLLSTLLPCLSWATGATWTTVTLPEAKNARSATAMNGANDSDQLTQINVLNRGLDLSLGSVEAGLNKNTDEDTFLSVTWPVANEGYWTGDSILFTGRNYYNGVSAALVVGEEIPAGTILKGVRLKATIASGSDVARTVGYGIGVASNGATSFNEGFTATSEATGSTSQDTSTELTLSFDNYTWNGGDKIIVALCGVGVGTNQNAYTIKDISVEYLTKENYLEYVKTFPTPVVLADFGTSTEITDNTDGWVSVAATSATTNIDCGNGVIFATSGRKYGSTTDKVFTNGNFMDPFSQKGGGYSSVLKEMQTTLGLKAPVPTGVYQDGIHSGWGGSGVATVTINGLNPKQCYTLYAIGGATTTDNNPQFNLVTYDTTKTPIINYAKQDSTSYQTAEGVISLSKYDLLLVRVYNLYPNSDGIIAFKTDEENKATTYREGFNCVALAATFPVYTRTLESVSETWTEAEDAITWSPAITKPADESAAVLTADVETTLTVDSDASLGVLSINGEDVTLSGTDVTLSAITTVVNANTDVSGITANLGAVTIAEGATLTVGENTTFSSMTNNGTLIVNGTCTIDKAISGSGSLTVNSGTLTLTGANTYTGGTVVDGTGVLILDGNDTDNYATKPLNDGSVVTVGANATVQLADGLVFANYSGAGTIEVTGNFVAGASTKTTTQKYIPSAFGYFTGTLRVNSEKTLSLRSFDSDLMGLSGCNLDIQGTIEKDNWSNTQNVTITVASDKTLSGNGTISVPVTLASGATIDASTATAEKCLTLSGGVTLPDSETVTIDVDGLTATTDTTILAATAALDTAKFALTGAAEGWTLEASGNNLVLAAPYTGEFSVADAAGIKAAVDAITEAKADATITLTGSINLGSTDSDTLVIDAGEGNTVTIELNGQMISADVPVIRIQSGTLKLVAGENGYNSVASSNAVAIVVGADDNAGTTVANEACALDIGAGVNVSTNATIAVNVVSGTVGGAGSILGGLNLEDGTTIDAKNGHLTITGNAATARIHFPEPVSDGTGGTTKSTVTFLMPEGLVYPQEIIKCIHASMKHAENVTICVNDHLHNNYGLTVMVDNQTGEVAAYGLSQYVCSADDRNFTSVAEAIRAGEEEITLRANVKEDIVVPSGVKLDLYSTATHAPYKVTGNVTVESGAILEPRGGDIEGNLILKDGATLSVYSEVQEPDYYDFHVSGTVTFPTGTITVIAEKEGTTVELGVPKQIISSGVALTPGATLEGTTVNVVSAAGQAASKVVKVISTSYTYEIVSTTEGDCTLDGIDYADINQALGAYSARGNKMLTLKSAPTLTETLVIDVDDPATDEIEEITIDLASFAISADFATSMPTIRVQSGKLNLLASTHGQIPAVTGATAIVVGADENGAATEKAALHIDDSVTVMAATYAVDVVSGTLSGDATLAGNLNLRDDAIVDASAVALTMGTRNEVQYNVTFPGTEAARGTITVIPPVGETQATFVNLPGALKAAHQYTDVQVILTDTVVSKDYEIIETYETVDGTQVATGYAVWAGEYVAATIVGEEIAYHDSFAAAAAAAGSTGTIILLQDLVQDLKLEMDVPTDLYTNGFDITTSGARKITGKLTITDGTTITLADALTVEKVELVEYADAAVVGTITSAGNVTIKGTLSGMYTINGDVVLTDGAGLTGYAGVTSVTVSEGATVTIDATLNTNLTVNNATINGTGTIEIGEGKTLKGAGTINTTVILDNGAIVDTCGYASNFLVLTNLTNLTEDILITVKADTLSNVINAGTAAIATSNFTLTLADGSTYEAYNPGTPQALDTDAELLIPVVATRNGENVLGIVKLNYYIGGARIADPEVQGDAGVGVAKQLAAYGYRYGILEIKGIDTASSDPVEGFQLFTNVVNGFVGDYLVITYDFGVTGTTIVAKTTTTGTGEAAVTTVTKYVLVTADVDGIYDKTEGDLSGNANYRDTTTVELLDENGTAITGAVPVTEANDDTYGVTVTDLPGVKYFIVPYNNLFNGATGPSTTKQFKVKATNE